jgi:hypothetical protein
VRCATDTFGNWAGGPYQEANSSSGIPLELSLISELSCEALYDYGPRS